MQPNTLVVALLLAATSVPIFPWVGGGGGGGGGVPPISVTVDLPAIDNSSCVYQSVTVAGATAGDMVIAAADFYMGDDVAVGNARVTATNTVELTVCNIGTFVNTDPPSGTFRFKLER